MARVILATVKLRDTGELQALRASLREALAAHADEVVVADVVVATQEAVTNSLRSGADAGRSVKVSVQLDGDFVWVEVRDRGCGVPSARAWEAQPSMETTHGRGLFLMRNLMDVLEISTRPTGSRVRMGKRLAV